MTTQLELDAVTDTVLADIVRQTGLDAVSVVRNALQQKQEQLYSQQRAAFRVAELKEIMKRLTPAPGERTYMSHEEGDAWLYDENGLPH